MDTHREVVVGLFHHAPRARDAHGTLRNVGLSDADMNLLMSDAPPATIFATLRRGGVPEEEVAFYVEELRCGSSLVAITAKDRADEAAAILLRFGAYDVLHHSQPHVASRA
jgi:hypothetical protein